jgi:phosphatidylinositol 4-kinase
MLFFEIIETSQHSLHSKAPNGTREPTRRSRPAEEEGISQALEKMMVYSLEQGKRPKEGEEGKRPKEGEQGPGADSGGPGEAAHPHGEEDWVLMDKGTKLDQSDTILALAFRELWQSREERIRKASPHASLPGWRIDSVIVKSGDDLRQEQLAMQLITTFHQIFQEAELNLWLKPYYVVATSSNTGLIQAISDAVSVDTLKKRLPNMSNLVDYFESVYGDKSSIKFLQAQRNFVESLAGYSLVCYLLQIKDRHNGNILLDKDGHIIHIDYGFMLTSSPGSINFETAPFKLTHEFLDVMGGEQSDMFSYFRLLFVRGFLEVRKHYKRIILLVEMMLPGHKMGCFARKEATVKELADRFQVQLSDKECIAFVTNLIKESIGNWRTESYDNYQWWRNGILV